MNPDLHTNTDQSQGGHPMIDSTPAITRAMIFAAGLGTRFKPWTDSHPKALAIINGKSLLQRNIEYLQQYGISEVVVNVHHFAGQIIEALTANRGWGMPFTISDETDQVLETGGGLKKARIFLDNAPFVLMNVDILTNLDLSGMIRDHFQHRPLATLAVTNRNTSRYFLFNEQQELCGWRNVQTGQERIARPAGPQSGNMNRLHTDAALLIPKAFSGIHIIDSAIFPLIRQEGKFSMVDLYLDLATAHTIRGFDHSDSLLIDVGKPDSAERAAVMFP